MQWLDLPNTGQFRVMAMNLNATASVLAPGGVLQQGQYITSPTKKCYLTQQTDGNLVLYAGSGPSAKGALLWNAGTTGSGGVFYTIMQGDGNLVTYSGTPSAQTGMLWSTATVARANYYLQVTDAGQVQIMCGNAPVWVNSVNQKNSVLAQGGFLSKGEYLTSPSGNCYVVQQDDGNLVLYNGTPANQTGFLWGSSNENRKILLAGRLLPGDADGWQSGDVCRNALCAGSPHLAQRDLQSPEQLSAGHGQQAGTGRQRNHRSLASALSIPLCFAFVYSTSGQGLTLPFFYPPFI